MPPFRLTIKVRVIAAMVAVLAVVMVAVLTYITGRMSADARRTGFAYADEVTQRNAVQIGQAIQNGLSTARDMAQVLEADSSTGGSRRTANAELRSVLAEHSEFVGTWTAWEPDAFDGRDRDFRKADAAHDATGRLVPYWFRNGDKISVTPLLDYEKAGAGDYYVIARNSGREKIIEPYVYNVGGQDVLMTSVASRSCATEPWWASRGSTCG